MSLNFVDPRVSFSELQKIRKDTKIPLPATLLNPQTISTQDIKVSIGDCEENSDVRAAFPNTYGMSGVSFQISETATLRDEFLKVGVVLSGGQASGGHNVIVGVFDFIKRLSPKSQLFGFLDGPQGIYKGQYAELTAEAIDSFRNSGGFDMIGAGRHKIEKPEEFAASLRTCTELGLTGLVVIGGDDSNTNAALLAEYFAANGATTRVIGCPKTIDGDLKVFPHIPISFGFDTACRVYSEQIGNLCQDTLSTQKYFHFVRLMGRSASHIALECALQTRPNMCIICEEVQAKHVTLPQLTHQLVNLIVKRRAIGKDYGVVLLPEGLIEFFPEFGVLIREINDLLDKGVAAVVGDVMARLTAPSQVAFAYLPVTIQHQLLLDRDPHGNVQVAKIETEKLLAETVAAELENLRREGRYSGKFSAVCHSYGYEGRAGLPSDFDATYCYALGNTCAALIHQNQTGLIASVTNLPAAVSAWQCGGVPISSLCNMEWRHSHMKPVIKKALVDLEDVPFQTFKAIRGDWELYDLYRSPGPLQYPEASAVVELCITLTLEISKYDVRTDASLLLAAKKNEEASWAVFRSGQPRYCPVTTSTLDILSDLQRERLKYRPELAHCLANPHHHARPVLTSSQCRKPSDTLIAGQTFPHSNGAPLVQVVAGGGCGTPKSSVSARNVGVLFCGRQSPGGHDIIAGIFDAVRKTENPVLVYGFVGGTLGLFRGQGVVLTSEVVDAYRGQGGFDLLGRSVDQIQGADQCEKIVASCGKLDIGVLVLIGGSRTATDSAYLNEYLRAQGVALQVLLVPADICASLKSDLVEASVGFDTATKLSAQIVGNISTDGASAKKYYYFMKFIGQEVSHVALEVALLTFPNCVILSEEVLQHSMSLKDIVRSVADVVAARAALGKNYGTVVVPEGLIGFIPEIKLLVQEIADIQAEVAATNREAGVKGSASVATMRTKLSTWNGALLASLPTYIQTQLFLEASSDGSLQHSHIETERLLADLVEQELVARKKKGAYRGSFSPVCSFIGYQARGAAPTNFDVTLAYNLGVAAVALAAGGLSGYVVTINNTKQPVGQWCPYGVPLTALMETPAGLSGAHQERSRPLVIPKSFVDIQASPAYTEVLSHRRACVSRDLYQNPGPIQYQGVTADICTRSLALGEFVGFIFWSL
jgi:6-phosphofructokinase 1